MVVLYGGKGMMVMWVLDVAVGSARANETREMMEMDNSSSDVPSSSRFGLTSWTGAGYGPRGTQGLSLVSHDTRFESAIRPV
jgi:hypothetical protein